MQRILTILGLGAVVAGALVGVPGVRGAEVSTTVYVGRHFEVRDQGQPVKYVFQGNQRVARIAGSLSGNSRLQRWALRAGWNLVALTVTATNLTAQLRPDAGGADPRIQSVLRWHPDTGEHVVVGEGQTVEAGAVLWLRARADGVVTVAGEVGAGQAPLVPSGGGFVASPAWRLWAPSWPAGVMIWKFDPENGRWRMASTSDLAVAGEPPPALAPGEVVYLQADRPVEPGGPDRAQDILYYHTDHLSSCSVIADAGGTPVEESSWFPFGGLRHHERLEAIDAAYGFTQNERDPESGLQYVGHRYLQPVLGRWLSADPLAERGGGQNLYAYVNQNPLKYLDPDGARITITPNQPRNPTRYAITMTVVLMDTSSKKFSQTELAKYADRIKSGLERNFTSRPDSKDKVKWSATVNMRVVTSWKDIREDEHVYQIVDRLNGAGETTEGGMLMKIRVNRFTQKHPDEVDRSRPENKNYTLKNFTSLEGTTSHEMGHAGGLPHDDTHKNLMQQGSEREDDNQTVTREMIESMFKAQQAGRLNKPQQELLDRRSGK